MYKFDEYFDIVYSFAAAVFYIARWFEYDSTESHIERLWRVSSKVQVLYCVYYLLVFLCVAMSQCISEIGNSPYHASTVSSP